MKSEKSITATALSSPADAGRTCYLCGGTKFDLLYSWEVGELRNSALIPIAVWKCECGVVILHPVPTAAQLPDSGDWWSKKRSKVIRRPELKRLRRKVGRFLIGSPVSRFIKDTHKVVPAGRLLDVGCGTGKLMTEASAYYQCAGLDPSEQALVTAREAGFEAILGVVEDAKIESESFDVVTMYSVIEHVLDPLRVLKIVNRVLKPGGVVALQTPKLGGPAYRRHGKHWNGFRPGYHTCLFDGRTLGKTLEQAGFKVLDSPKRDRMLDDILILWGQKPARL